jgi:hypothetical protein
VRAVRTCAVRACACECNSICVARVRWWRRRRDLLVALGPGTGGVPHARSSDLVHRAHHTRVDLRVSCRACRVVRVVRFDLESWAGEGRPNRGARRRALERLAQRLELLDSHAPVRVCVSTTVQARQCGVCGVSGGVVCTCSRGTRRGCGSRARWRGSARCAACPPADSRKARACAAVGQLRDTTRHDTRSSD